MVESEWRLSMLPFFPIAVVDFGFVPQISSFSQVSFHPQCCFSPLCFRLCVSL
jgi:hypothetical protein